MVCNGSTDVTAIDWLDSPTDELFTAEVCVNGKVLVPEAEPDGSTAGKTTEVNLVVFTGALVPSTDAVDWFPLLLDKGDKTFVVLDSLIISFELFGPVVSNTEGVKNNSTELFKL